MKPDKPSATAVLIAKSTVFMAGDARYRALISPDSLELSLALLAAATSHKMAQLWKLFGRYGWARRIASAVEQRSVPGMIGHYLVRKRQLEVMVEQWSMSQSSSHQLVVLGAGLDTLGIRMAGRHPALRVLELDHPATSAVKQQALAGADVSTPSNLLLMPVDLSVTPLHKALQSESGFSWSQPTLILAEGVFMYLEMAAVGETLSILHRFKEGSAVFVFTYMDRSRSDGRIGFAGQSPQVDRWLGRRQEPFLWGASPTELDAFLRAKKLKPLGHWDAADLRRLYLSSPEFLDFKTAEGENIVLVSNQ